MILLTLFNIDLVVEMHSVFVLLIIIPSWNAHIFVCVMYSFYYLTDFTIEKS